MEAAESENEFEAVKTRLEEIAHEVEDESLSLDQALDLYEEAIKLGLKASDLLEVGVEVEGAPPADSAQSQSAGEDNLGSSAKTQPADSEPQQAGAENAAAESSAVENVPVVG